MLRIPRTRLQTALAGVFGGEGESGGETGSSVDIFGMEKRSGAFVDLFHMRKIAVGFISDHGKQEVEPDQVGHDHGEDHGVGKVEHVGE
jgi:hypothetical protein